MIRKILLSLTILAFMFVLTSCIMSLFGTEQEREFPSLHITSELNPFVQDRDLWHNGTITLDSIHPDHAFEDVAVRLRGRGNSTWRDGTDKRPLRIRFETPSPMFGSEPHRDWILLANHFDRSLLRNYTALTLASMLDGLDFTPMSRFVHLYVNDEYMGVYQVTDERDVALSRAPLVFNEYPAWSDFFLELDGHSLTNENAIEGEDYFVVRDRAYDLRWPSFTEEHMADAQAFIQRVSDAIMAHDWAAVQLLMDMPSLIDFYIVQELMRNPDVDRFSVFMTLRGSGEDRRLFMGPVWDFDQSAGNVQRFVQPYGAFAAAYHYWYRELFEIPEFAEMVAQRWNEVRNNEVARTLAHVRHVANHHSEDFERNFIRHNIFEEPPEWEWVNAYSIREIYGFTAQAEHLFTWLESRIEWLDNHFNNR